MRVSGCICWSDVVLSVTDSPTEAASLCLRRKGSQRLRLEQGGSCPVPGPQGARPGFKVTVRTKWGWWSVLPTAYETQLVPRVGRDPWLCHLLPSATTAQTPPCLSSASSGLSPTFQQGSPSAHPRGCVPDADTGRLNSTDLTHTHRSSPSFPSPGLAFFKTILPTASPYSVQVLKGRPPLFNGWEMSLQQRGWQMQEALRQE